MTITMGSLRVGDLVQYTKRPERWWLLIRMASNDIWDPKHITWYGYCLERKTILTVLIGYDNTPLEHTVVCRSEDL